MSGSERGLATVGIVCPRSSGPAGGNRVTALRWAARARQAGRQAFVVPEWTPHERETDLLVALHAVKSRSSAERFLAAHPERPLVVGLAGTDLYGSLEGRTRPSAEVLDLLRAARRVVVLQAKALEALPPDLRARTRVIHQAVEVPPGLPRPAPGRLDACLVAHLRPVKDPLLALRAVERLPPGPPFLLRLIGGSLDPGLTAAVEAAAARDPRVRWSGPLPRRRVLEELARSHLCLSTSRDEGGSNAVGEALALDVAVLATAIPGTIGLLGEDHPGLFPPGDAEALTALLARAQAEPAFLEELRRHGRARAPLVLPAAERALWRELLDELLPASHHAPAGPGRRDRGGPDPREPRAPHGRRPAR